MAIDFAAFRALALALPDVEEGSSYGTPAFKLRGKLMARLKEDGGTVVLRTSWEQRERLLVLHPRACLVTDHYRAHPWVLLRLAAAGRPLATALLRQAWQLTATPALRRRHGVEPPPG